MASGVREPTVKQGSSTIQKQRVEPSFLMKWVVEEVERSRFGVSRATASRVEPADRP